MAKRKKQKQNAATTESRSVNPLGNSPDTEFSGEVYSKGQHAAKKENTK
ncbi:small, acid-soluble spore protein L [Desertibacillus haloalkaliphilus]|nr:small, acid-soluble spore protein L [Desertibacillus haloalkaliphilus]MBU8907456.1 small, acid-soluble spore protein L [Desertibacillus haloalkaliphilus]